MQDTLRFLRPARLAFVPCSSSSEMTPSGKDRRRDSGLYYTCCALKISQSSTSVLKIMLIPNLIPFLVMLQFGLFQRRASNHSSIETLHPNAFCLCRATTPLIYPSANGFETEPMIFSLIQVLCGQGKKLRRETTRIGPLGSVMSLSSAS